MRLQEKQRARAARHPRGGKRRPIPKKRPARLPRGEIYPTGWKEVQGLARNLGITLKLCRLAGRGNAEDSARVAFIQGRWTVATWWTGSGRLRVGPRERLAKTLRAAWEAVARLGVNIGQSDLASSREGKTREVGK